METTAQTQSEVIPFQVNARAASHCLVCNRALKDAKSIELGIGPICRANTEFEKEVPEDVRKRANALVYKIACGVSLEEMLVLCDELSGLGFEKLVASVFRRNASMVVTSIPVSSGGAMLRFEVQRRNDKFLREFYRAGGKYNGQTREWLVRDNTKVRNRLWLAAKAYFKGEMILGDKGCKIV